MSINILIPYKEKFEKETASSVSITIKNNMKISKMRDRISVYGREINNPMFKKNYVKLKDSKNFFKSKNVNLAEQMCFKINLRKDSNIIIEIHNRPYLISIVNRLVKSKKIVLYLHNNPLEMKGSKKVSDRETLLEKVDYIVCVSEFIKKKFMLGLSKSTNKVLVIHNGVDRKHEYIPQKKKRIIFVGRIVKEKGVHHYVEAISNISMKYENWEYLLIGASKSKSQIFGNYSKSVITKFKKLTNAKYLGSLPHQEVQNIMMETSIIVVPSIWDEPFGLVVAEAMSNGVAVICSNLGGIPEIIRDYGIILNDVNRNDIEKSLCLLMSNSKLLKNYQKKSWDGFKHTSSLSSEKIDSYRRILMSKF